MFYSDYVENRIYSASLDTGEDVEMLLDDAVEVPGKLTERERESTIAQAPLLKAIKILLHNAENHERTTNNTFIDLASQNINNYMEQKFSTDIFFRLNLLFHY